MGRPKGSKNKSKIAEPVEFDYEQEAEQAYASAMNPGAPQIAATPGVEFDYAELDEAGGVAVRAGATPVSLGDSVFLIVGSVRLDRQGQAPITAEQTRIVYASDFNQAVAKFTSYFAGLSNATDRYTVVGASGSEAIR